MSYLNAVRLHFAGQFQADPSTVNNRPRFFNNATFKPEFQDRPLGLWNPDGSGSWRLVGCRVTRVCYADGTSTTDPKADPVVGLNIMDANKRVAGKLVDLDPQQQMVSEIWGLIVRLTNGTDDYFSGSYEPAAFSDLWQRAMEAGRPGQMPLAAFYQSVIAPVVWGAPLKSRFLDELRGAAKDDMLSIKFNVDGFDTNFQSAQFTLGRLTGTIGPASADEPHHFILGRHLGGQADLHMTYMPCVVDTNAKTLTADFGNAIATHKPGGALMNIGDMTIGWVNPQSGRLQGFTVPYRDAGWYESTAGVQTFKLTDDQLAMLDGNAVIVAINGQLVLTENVDGWYVRADQFVYRLSPNETVDVQLYATQYGVLADGAPIVVSYDDSGLQGSPQSNPPAATPDSGVTWPNPTAPLIAANGRATLTLTAGVLENPRGYIDGQVYGIRPQPQAVANNAPGSWTDPADFISVLVWDPFEVEDPAWFPDLQPVFTQYGNLYPLMDKLIDLTSYDDVVAHANILSFVFGLPVSDPNSMPVTRDLSPAKRAAILKWLQNPKLGAIPPAAAAAAAPEEKVAVFAAEEALPRAAGDKLFRLKSGLERHGEEE